MSSDLAQTRAALARDLASLEELLSDDADWQALCAFGAHLGQGLPRQLDSGAALDLPGDLCNSLNRNPLFQARARILEALEILQIDAAASERPPAGEPSQSHPSAENSNIPEAQPLEPDDLTRIRGINSALAVDLNRLGIVGYDQIAAWNADDVSAVAHALDLGNTISRQNWIEQAALLALKEGRTIVKEPAAPASPAKSLGSTQKVEAALTKLIEQARALPAPSSVVPVARDATEETSSFEPPEPEASEVSPQRTRLPIVDEMSDDLRHIAFIDDEVANRLKSSGILTFSDIAHFTVDQVAMVSVRFGLGNRITREQWIEQAAVLATGRTTAYARRVKAGEIGSLLSPPLPVEFPEKSSPNSAPSPSPSSERQAPVVPGPSLGMSSPAHIAGSTDALPATEPKSGGEAGPPPLPPMQRVAGPEPTPPVAITSEPAKPPPVPEFFAELASQYPRPQYEEGADGEDNPDQNIRIVPRSHRNARGRGVGAEPSVRSSARRWTQEDGPLLRNPTDWEPIEEAAVEIVPRLPQFPGVGPVQDAASRLQSAVEPPSPALSRLFRVLQRR